MEAKEILIKLLHLELVTNASRLKFIEGDSGEQIEEEFLNSKNTLLTSFWFYNELKLLNLKNQRADLFCSF